MENKKFIDRILTEKEKREMKIILIKYLFIFLLIFMILWSTFGQIKWIK